MIVQRGFEQPSDWRGGQLSIGNFDGVHRGHQAILRELVRQARAAGGPAVVLTFDPHPISILAPAHAPPTLTTLARKTELIARCGVDCLIVYPTSTELLSLTPEEFFQRIVRGTLEARGLVEGPNFFFGRDRRGNVAVLRDFCHGAGMSLRVAPPAVQDGETISSSAIRRAIAAGEVGRAVAMLGHPYEIEGEVVTGAKRGRDIGFPTANLAAVATLLPPNGVYAGWATVDGSPYAAAVHLGPNPTFGEQDRKLEVHLIGYSGDLYGQRLAVELLDRVRETRKFDGLAALKSQLAADVARVKELFAAAGGGGAGGAVVRGSSERTS